MNSVLGDHPEKGDPLPSLIHAPALRCGWLFWILPALFAACLLYYALELPRFEGDSEWLARSVLKLRGDIDGKSYPDASKDYQHFALFQHLTGLALSWIRPTMKALLHGWAIISTLSYVGCFLVLFFTVRRFCGLPSAWIACLILLLGPFVWYASSTFGESAAAFVTLLFTAAVLLRWPWWFAIPLFWAAGISKETAFPFLIAFWLMAIWLLPPASQRSRLGPMAALGAATLLTVATNVWFNYYRYHTWYNLVDAVPTNHVPLFSAQHMKFVAGHWLAPNGGLAIYWPAMVLAILVTTLAKVRSFFALRQRLSSLLPLTGILAILAGLTFGFSAWWAPFGWWCWGTRLILPWLPSCLLLLFCFHPHEWKAITNALIRRAWALWLLALPLAVAAWPHLVVLYNRRPYYDFFDVAKNPDYPKAVFGGDANYYTVITYMMWRRHCVLFDTFCWFNRPAPFLLAGLLTGAVLCILAWLWTRQRAKQEVLQPKQTVPLSAAMGH